MSVRVKVEGLDRLKRRLRKLGELPAAVVDDMRGEAARAAERARRAGGRDTGALHEATRATPTKTGAVIELSAHYRGQLNKMRRAVNTPRIAEDVLQRTRARVSAAVGKAEKRKP